VFNRQRITYEPKWTIPLIDLTLDDKIAVEGGKLVSVMLVIAAVTVTMMILSRLTVDGYTWSTVLVVVDCTIRGKSKVLP